LSGVVPVAPDAGVAAGKEVVVVGLGEAAAAESGPKIAAPAIPPTTSAPTILARAVFRPGLGEAPDAVGRGGAV
jgi:hypothetical protein